MSELPSHPLKHWTSARVGLGRAGGSLPWPAARDFRLAHARARDAVHQPFDAVLLQHDLEPLGLPILKIETEVHDRATYLQRPDWGRKISSESQALLSEQQTNQGFDLVIILSDGLSAAAAQLQIPPLLTALLPLLGSWSLAPLVIAPFARVAVQDAIGQAIGASNALMLLGERPGLSSPDSLGAYLVRDPKSGNTDANRNCVSNIRPAGLEPAAAAHRISWLLHESRRIGTTGVGLKDDSDSLPIADQGRVM
ncbi:ethanolamine ammonia-lyase subunit EutC [Luteolibacter pohnpeiensis]|uniref:Ethanolamine ammonia-lyase small subunit n=1 Tax=Luteolibacter pohnpeiensis TaxID=454153 RepID=A0A934VXM2_9BACT|nr:ethanolamine ammonia-lyase subunit EutC [Luteolibacter pohnpeiensis]MBK1884003.1 ethanolamine ammonia-lyase subunit EutC [Luteolibacter pohnpeiensis]